MSTLTDNGTVGTRTSVNGTVGTRTYMYTRRVWPQLRS